MNTNLAISQSSFFNQKKDIVLINPSYIDKENLKAGGKELGGYVCSIFVIGMGTTIALTAAAIIATISTAVVAIATGSLYLSMLTLGISVGATIAIGVVTALIIHSWIPVHFAG